MANSAANFRIKMLNITFEKLPLQKAMWLYDVELSRSGCTLVVSCGVADKLIHKCMLLLLR